MFALLADQVSVNGYMQSTLVRPTPSVGRATRSTTIKSNTAPTDGLHYFSTSSFTNCTSSIHQRKMSTKLYAIKPSPGKGRGIFATKAIPAGTNVMKDRIALQVQKAGPSVREEDVLKGFEKLSPADQQRFLELHDGHRQYNKIFRIWKGMYVMMVVVVVDWRAPSYSSSSSQKFFQRTAYFFLMHLPQRMFLEATDPQSCTLKFLSSTTPAFRMRSSAGKAMLRTSSL